MARQPFMTTLNYASCNEDWRSEWDALQITTNDRILCVTGSGDRPLNLLVKKPRHVLSIDVNAVQNHLLRLKMAALVSLPYDEYASFLGLRDGMDREKLWRKLRQRMPIESRNFWDKQTDLLSKGIIYQGRWEHHIRKMTFIAQLLRGRELRHLFAFDDVQEQRKFVAERWDKWWWKKIFELLGSASFSRLFFGDPGFYQYVDPEMNIGKYLFETMREYLESHLARESFMLSLMFNSKLTEHDLPPYLDPGHVKQIAEKAEALKVITGNILEFLESVPEKSLTKFSLSDVPSFLNQDGFERLLDGLVRSGAPGARFCIRQFLTEHGVPDRLKKTVVRESELEERLRKKDRSFAYRFIIGSLRAPPGKRFA